MFRIFFLLTLFITASFSEDVHSKEQLDEMLYHEKELSFINKIYADAFIDIKNKKYSNAAKKYENILSLIPTMKYNSYDKFQIKDISIKLYKRISTTYFMSKEYEKAYFWTKKLSDSYFNIFNIAYRIALFDFLGLGTKKNYASAYKNFDRASKSSNRKNLKIVMDSLYFLSIMHYEGLGIDKNKEKAVALYKYSLEKTKKKESDISLVIKNKDEKAFKELEQIFLNEIKK